MRLGLDYRGENGIRSGSSGCGSVKPFVMTEDAHRRLVELGSGFRIRARATVRARLEEARLGGTDTLRGAPGAEGTPPPPKKKTGGGAPSFLQSQECILIRSYHRRSVPVPLRSYSLLTARYSLLKLTTHYSLLTTYYLLLTAGSAWTGYDRESRGS